MRYVQLLQASLGKPSKRNKALLPDRCKHIFILFQSPSAWATCLVWTAILDAGALSTCGHWFLNDTFQPFA